MASDRTGLGIGVADGCEVRVSQPSMRRKAASQVIMRGEAGNPGEVGVILAPLSPGAGVAVSPDEPQMVGCGPEMQSIFQRIRRYASSDAPVLVTGESGTGKELAVLAIHERSSRSDGPFIPVNCAGLPATLVASELFGHEKGAFTGAVQRKIGRIEAATGGTVLLDEIGDLPMEMQPQLLRFLQEGTVDRVGSARPLRVDVRVIAATNRDLAAEVEAGRFREDLYYRLNVLPLHMPPLRARTADLDVLCQHFLDTLAPGEGRGASPRAQRRLSPDAIAAVHAYHWPGNIRELICHLRKAIVLASSEVITAADLDLPTVAKNARSAEVDAHCDSPREIRLPQAPVTMHEAKNEIERLVLSDALRRHAGKITAAAGELGVSRVTLYRLIEKHRISARNDIRRFKMSC